MKKNETLEEDKPKIFKYYNDTRSEREKELTDLLVRSLSDLNFQLLNHHLPSSTSPQTPSPSKANRKQDFLYVCINGVPPFDNQFQFLQLPGECINFAFPSFDKGLTGEQVLALRTQFTQLAHSLHRKISEGSAQKPIVFVYHSFGTYVFASYCQLYPIHRIVGIIDVGGAPIRFYPALKEFLGSLWDVSLEQIQKNLEEAHLIIAERNKSLGIKAYDRKEELYGVCKAFKSEPGFRQMFEYNRNFPKVLKCFIFGRKDSLFVESLINQKMVYYAYQNKLDEAYATSIQGAYQQCFGRKCKNVQERFIYSFERGHHSVHMQKKYRQLNAKIVNHYLTFLEELHSGKQAKL